VAGYRLYRGLPEEEPEPIVTVGTSTFSFIDDKVEKGKRYFYQVVAVDRAGNESKPTPKFYVTVRDTTSPPTPTNLKAIFHKKKGVILSWDKVEVDDLAGYRAYYAEIPSGVYKLLNPDELIKETKFVHKEGKEGLYYKVTSVDTSLNESRSPEPVRSISD
jgi:fibronectin type 3 domain-containing protein